MAPTWYLGPAGDLRALTCPEPDISTPVVRYGGVHQGLSGARTMDVTGHRQDFEFNWTYMDYDEWSWLQALHLRHIPGPYRLINPMQKNRLTSEASSGKVWSGTYRGAEVQGGFGSRVYDWPAAAGLGALSTKWTGRSGVGVLRFDSLRWTPLKTPGETITGSVWMKASAPVTGPFGFDWYDRNDVQLGTSTQVDINLTTTWQRFDITAVGVTDAVAGNLFFYTFNDVPDIYFAAAQVEEGATLTDWELGGGCPAVLIDQMPTQTPRFPLTDVTLTLMEA